MNPKEVSALKGQGVLMRLLEMKGDDYSIDEVVIKPGVKANWLRFPNTRVEHRARKKGGKIEVHGKKKLFVNPTSRARVLDKGEWHRLINESSEPLTAKVKLTPAWNPQRAYFRVGEKEYRGDEVWFELKTYLGDTSARAMYQLHQLSAKKGNVSVLLKPGTRSLETYHTEGKVVVKGVEGSGLLYLNGKPEEITKNKKVEIKFNTRYYFENNTKEPLEVNQVHTPQWEPESTFYVYGDEPIPGDEVWFEFVVAE